VTRALAFIIVVALAVSAGWTSSVSAERFTSRVTFRTDDGVTIAATWYETSARPAPAVILVHALGKSRRDWDQVASQAASEGIGALAIDLRGHGESPGSAQDYAAMVQDVRAARRFLGTRSEVTPSRIAIAGASIGASLAALVAAEDSSVAGLVLLSATTDYRGLRIEPALRKYGARPLLLVASDDDGFAMRSMRELQKARGSAGETVVLSRAGNGMAMLAADQDLSRRLVDWLKRTLL
jgi:alpha-beta hydrolase superfamily lysophospholipase